MHKYTHSHRKHFAESRLLHMGGKGSPESQNSPDPKEVKTSETEVDTKTNELIALIEGNIEGADDITDLLVERVEDLAKDAQNSAEVTTQDLNSTLLTNVQRSMNVYQNIAKEYADALKGGGNTSGLSQESSNKFHQFIGQGDALDDILERQEGTAESVTWQKTGGQNKESGSQEGQPFAKVDDPVKEPEPKKKPAPTSEKPRKKETAKTKETKEIPQAKLAPIGQIREDTDGDFWHKTEDGWRSYDNGEDMISGSGKRGLSWSDATMDKYTKRIIEVKTNTKKPEEKESKEKADESLTEQLRTERNALEEKLSAKEDIDGKSIFKEILEKNQSYKIENLAKPESKEALARYQMHMRELNKIANAPTEWAAIPGFGKTDRSGKIYMYKLEGDTLAAYAPPGDYQQLDAVSGKWRRSSAPKKSGLTDIHKTIMRAEKSEGYRSNYHLEDALHKSVDTVKAVAKDVANWTKENTPIFISLGIKKPDGVAFASVSDPLDPPNKNAAPKKVVEKKQPVVQEEAKEPTQKVPEKQEKPLERIVFSTVEEADQKIKEIESALKKLPNSPDYNRKDYARLQAQGRDLVQRRNTLVLHKLKSRSEDMIRREQSMIDGVSKDKEDSGWFGKLNRFVTGSDPYAIEISNAKQKIGIIKNVQNTLITSIEQELAKGPEKSDANKVNDLLGRVTNSWKTLNKVDLDTTHFDVEQDAISVTRDVSIAVITLPAAFTGAPATAGTAAAAKFGAMKGAQIAAMSSGTANIDEVQQGNKTVTEGVVDTTLDTVTGAALGGVIGAGADKLANAGRNLVGKFRAKPNTAAPKGAPKSKPNAKAKTNNTGPKESGPHAGKWKTNGEPAGGPKGGPRSGAKAKPNTSSKPGPKSKPDAKANPKGGPKQKSKTNNSQERASNSRSRAEQRALNKKLQRVPQAWDDLGIPPGSSKEVAKKAYKKLMVKNHPDRNPSQDATAIFKKANEAWEALEAYYAKMAL